MHELCCAAPHSKAGVSAALRPHQLRRDLITIMAPRLLTRVCLVANAEQVGVALQQVHRAGGSTPAAMVSGKCSLVAQQPAHRPVCCREA